jgi:hypothetical protein
LHCRECFLAFVQKSCFGVLVIQTRWRFPRSRRRALRTTTPATRRRA